MTRRTLIVCLLCALSAIAVWAVVVRNSQWQALRVEKSRQLHELHRELLAKSTPARAATQAKEGQPPETPSPGTPADVSPQLLRLRNEATLLAAKRAELLPLRAENQQLRLKVAAMQTNMSAALPPGYMRKSQARLVGFATPENTLQSFLWAVHNRDVTNLLQALSPTSTQQLQTQSARDAFLNQMQAFVGMNVLEREELPDGRTKLKVQIMPDLPAGDITFQNVNGQWEMDMPR